MATNRTTRTSNPRAALQRVSHLAGRPIATIDMDGTCYDPWSCCGIAGNFQSSPTCTHIRADTLNDIETTLAATGATPVVLSYRMGLTATTIAWLADINVAVAGHTDHQLNNPRFTIEAMFTPGANTDISALAAPRTTGTGQTRFKTATVEALRDHLGCTLAASWDDNAEVVNGLTTSGVARATLVPHKVTIAPHEFAAGYLGAPKLPPRPPTPIAPASTNQLHLDLTSPGMCEWCGQPSWDDWLCTLCADADTPTQPEPEYRIGDTVVFLDHDAASAYDHTNPDDTFTIVSFDEFDGLVIRNDDTGELLWVCEHDVC